MLRLLRLLRLADLQDIVDIRMVHKARARIAWTQHRRTDDYTLIGNREDSRADSTGSVSARSWGNDFVAPPILTPDCMRF